MNINKKILFAAAFSFCLSQMGSAQDALQVKSWITNPDRSMLLKEQPTDEKASRRGWGHPDVTIVVDDSETYQTMDGFGYALTGGSARLLVTMSAPERTKILKELFGRGEGCVGVNYIRLTIGASDLNDFVFSYNDMPKGKTDVKLKNFNLGPDLKDVVPVMREILAIAPDIKILASPWSAPAWMKTNNDVKGGALKYEYYPAYAQYFVKYIQAMKQEGITVDAMTIQNEPLHPGNTPSMVMLADEQAVFIKKHLGPAFKQADIKTKIVLYDHNCDKPQYPITVLNDPEAAQYIDGSGFHLYGGEIAAMTTVHNLFPEKNLYFTEQMVVEDPKSATINIISPVTRLIIGASRNWSKNVILWNLAADPSNDPHTDNGGCSMCQGAITIDENNVSRNLAYYAVAHASKFIPMGSVRIASTETDCFPNVAFKTPEGKIVLVVANDSWSQRAFKVMYKGKPAVLRLNPGAVGTFVW